MALKQPKILTRLTVPTGGWTFKCYFSNAVQFDTPITVTIPAGDYYIAGDNQTDCLLYAICNQLIPAVVLAGFNPEISIYIDTDHKVVLKFHAFAGATRHDIRVAWTESSELLARALGFDHSADDDSTGVDYPAFTADWHHAYGWYATEDGQLAFYPLEDQGEATSLQSVSESGKVRTQKVALRHDSRIVLDWLEKELTHCREVNYGFQAPHPYVRNKGLEYWWREAIKGTPFRFYLDGLIDTARAAVSGLATGAAAAQLTDAGRAWDTDPQEWVGRILYIPMFLHSTLGVPQCFYIASNSATQLNVTAHPSGLTVPQSVGDAYYIFDHTYRTYVLDVKKMPRWEPLEDNDGLERFRVEIPVLRYVA